MQLACSYCSCKSTLYKFLNDDNEHSLLARLGKIMLLMLLVYALYKMKLFHFWGKSNMFLIMNTSQEIGYEPLITNLAYNLAYASLI